MCWWSSTIRMWDLYLIGKEKHQFLVNEFLQKNGAFLHALELNGLRNWDENRAVRRLAEQWNMLLISGGDRHGVEPNANMNLTNADKLYGVCARDSPGKAEQCLFLRNMPSLEASDSAIDHRCDPPLSRLSAGFALWDDRVSIPTREGVVRPLSELWPKGSHRA